MRGRIVSRRLVVQALAVLALGATSAQAGNVGMDLNIHIGDQPRQVIVREPVSPPPPVREVFVVDDDVDFVYPSRLGFYVAVGVPYDLFYVGKKYYLFRDGRWMCAHTPRGPWVVKSYRELPPHLRRHRLERIREYRSHEYDVYRRHRDHYRGRHLRVAREDWKAERRLEKAERKLEKAEHKYEKERRKAERDSDRHYRRHDGDGHGRGGDDHRGRGHGRD